MSEIQVRRMLSNIHVRMRNMPKGVNQRIIHLKKLADDTLHAMSVCPNIKGYNQIEISQALGSAANSIDNNIRRLKNYKKKVALRKGGDNFVKRRKFVYKLATFSDGPNNGIINSRRYKKNSGISNNTKNEMRMKLLTQLLPLIGSSARKKRVLPVWSDSVERKNDIRWD